VRAGPAAGLALAAIAAGIAGQLAAADPGAGAATEQQVIGHSIRGRPILAVQVGDPLGSRVALVVGVIHGDERVGLRIVDALKREAAAGAAALQGTQLWVIAAVNPDGLRAHTRKNAHGVDLNRNFPFHWQGDVPPSSGYYPGPRPASEPETTAVMAFANQIRPQVSIWYHQPWNAVLACRGSPQIAAEYAKLVGMRTSCRGKGLRGTVISWETHVFPGSTAFVVELLRGGISGGTADRHARAALTIAEGR
jgi:murein peptide amidase A